MSGFLTLIEEEILVAPLRYYRALGPEAPGGSLPGIVFFANVTESEEHRDQLYITEHPIEVGAAISDHAYKRPAELQLRLGWANSSQQDAFAVQNIYSQLLRLQADRCPMNVYTGKRPYFNMLIAGMITRTDAATEYSLMVDISLRQVFLVQTKTYSISTNSNNLSNPQAALPTQPQGSKVVQPASGLNMNDAAFQSGGALDGVTPSNTGQMPVMAPQSQTSITTNNTPTYNGIVPGL